MEREGGKGPEKHGHARARLGGINDGRGGAEGSVSSTCSQQLHDGVEDVKELRAVLRLRGIRQWYSDAVDFSVAAAAHLRLPLARWRGLGGNGMAREREGVRCRLGLHM
jgi:hypothetical protein